MTLLSMNGTALPHLLRLASPMLPVGAYAYSQGMEWAVEQGAVHDEPSALAWIVDLLRFNIGTLEAPVWRHLYRAWQEQDAEAAARWNARFIAIRETAEFRAETLQMGGAMKAVLEATGEMDVKLLDTIVAPAFPTAFSFAAHGLGIPVREGLTGYLWAWAENQVAAAMKLVPLGQSSGQRMVSRIIATLPAIADAALVMPEDALANFSPALAIASSRHETQYTRLFRS